MTAARLALHRADPHAAHHERDAAVNGHIGGEEVPHEPRESGQHGAYYRCVSETVHTRHGDLSLEQIADALPGTGELMASVGDSWWRCAYAARGGNWPLAAYFARRVRGTSRKLAVLRPKYAERVADFERGPLAGVFAAIETRDRPRFEDAFARATAAANQNHVETGYAYIRWVLPDEPPRDLDLGRGQE